MGSAPQLNVYRSCEPVVDARFEKGCKGTITDALVGALAEAEGVDATDIDPVYEAVDLATVAGLPRVVVMHLQVVFVIMTATALMTATIKLRQNLASL